MFPYIFRYTSTRKPIEFQMLPEIRAIKQLQNKLESWRHVGAVSFLADKECKWKA